MTPLFVLFHLLSVLIVVSAFRAPRSLHDNRFFFLNDHDNHNHIIQSNANAATDAKDAKNADSKIVDDRLTLARFPASDDPFTSVPPLHRNMTQHDEQSCVINIYDQVNLSSYDEIVKASLSQALFEHCPPFQQWQTLVLDFHGSVGGVQFDRFGGVWLGLVEVLRLTTPEPRGSDPSLKPVAWHVEVDVTAYKQYIVDRMAQLNGTLDAYLAIPNVVDSTYTGVIYVTVTLSIYGSLDRARTSASTPSFAPIVYPLTRAPSKNNLFSALSISNNTVTFPLSRSLLLSSSTSVASASLSSLSFQHLYLSVHVSNHGCEEFYYSNAIDAYAAQLSGGCGGGVYRELEARLDGVKCPAEPPYTTVYSGGFNPLLWRPSAGIQSFEIPALLVDLSPFLGVILDGSNHSLSLGIVGAPSSGVWYVDGALMLTYNSLVGPGVAGGRVLSHRDTGAQVNVSVESGAGRGDDSGSGSVSADPPVVFPTTITTTAVRESQVTGVVVYEDGVERELTVQGERNVENVNVWIDSDTQITNHSSKYVVTSSSPSGAVTISGSYPLYAHNKQSQDATTFDLNTSMQIQYKKKVTWTTKTKQKNGKIMKGEEQGVEGEQENKFPSSVSNLSVLFLNCISSVAHYNRSLDASRTVYFSTNASNDTFTVTVTGLPLPLDTTIVSKNKNNSGGKVSAEPCYARSVTSMDGAVEHDEGGDAAQYTCSKQLPEVVGVCGYHTCGFPSDQLDQLASAYVRVRN